MKRALSIAALYVAIPTGVLLVGALPGLAQDLFVATRGMVWAGLPVPAIIMYIVAVLPLYGVGLAIEYYVRQRQSEDR